MDVVLEEFLKRGYKFRKVGKYYINSKETERGYITIVYTPRNALNCFKIYKNQDLVTQRFFRANRDPVSVVNRLLEFYD